MRKHWLYWLIIPILTSILVILFLYFKTFNGPISDDHYVWGQFGSLLGAITGLIAFVGLIFTLRQNRNSEERSVFFDLLKIFISYRDDLRVKKRKWDTNNTFFHWDCEDLDILCEPEKTFNQIAFELEYIYSGTF